MATATKFLCGSHRHSHAGSRAVCDRREFRGCATEFDWAPMIFVAKCYEIPRVGSDWVYRICARISSSSMYFPRYWSIRIARISRRSDPTSKFPSGLLSVFAYPRYLRDLFPAPDGQGERTAAPSTPQVMVPGAARPLRSRCRYSSELITTSGRRSIHSWLARGSESVTNCQTQAR